MAGWGKEILDQIKAALPASLGQKAAAASTSVVLASDQGALTVTASGTVAISSVALPSAPLTDQVTVAAHGTAVPLAGASTPLVSGVRVKALAGNTGTVYIGDEDVAAATGYPLAAGEEVFVEINDLATVYVDAAEDGDAVAYLGS